MFYENLEDQPNQPLTAFPELAPPVFHNYDGAYDKIISSHGPLDPEMFFYLRTKKIANSILYDEMDCHKAIEALCAAYNVSLLHGITSRYVNFNKSSSRTRQMIVQISNDIVICKSINMSGLNVMYSDNVHWDELQHIEGILKNYRQEETHQKLNLLVNEPEMGGFHLEEFKLNNTEFEIDLHYNNDFKIINEIITTKLSEEKSKGIVLLHGKPGTGKTSYIRHLVHELKKKLIYIPSSLARRLGDPEFLPFLVNHTSSILIIEDAEDILQERHGDDSGTLANILNLGDGLLSDCLNIQIICTFNAPLTRIDKALLRKGRVIANYEFKPLTIEKSNKLLSTLSLHHVTTTELTLAEIFYLKDEDFAKPEKEIGFKK